MIISFVKRLIATGFCIAIAGAAIAQTSGDTLLNVTYENGTTNSGISGIDTTHATASDAVYMVSPGATGNYGVAHKIKMGDSAYYSDGNWRSESSTIAAYQYFPGEEHRYEVSLQMKDWPAWNAATDPLYGVVLFQLKMSDGVGEPLRIIAQRNSIYSRRSKVDKTQSQETLIPDYRPYANQWIDFRIDVKWATSAIGYMKIYVRLPGQQDYTLMAEEDNYVTFLSANNIGYLKWGVYNADAGVGGSLEGNNTLVFTAYHDNIRVIDLQKQALPVVFDSINAVKKGDQIVVNWTTDSEANNSYFEVQASFDGTNFKTIQTVQSKNSNSTVPQHYETVIAYSDILMAGLPFFLGLIGFKRDRRYNKRWNLLISFIIIMITVAACKKHSDASLSNTGQKLFIRIKQVNTDGKASYSSVITVL